jgi:hypothetical protein
MAKPEWDAFSAEMIFFVRDNAVTPARGDHQAKTLFMF